MDLLVREKSRLGCLKASRVALLLGEILELIEGLAHSLHRLLDLLRGSIPVALERWSNVRIS